MINAYRQAGNSTSAARNWLRTLHPSSSIEYARDTAAFTDWLAAGGQDTTRAIESVEGRACIQ
jgi:hypothetical protein